MPVDEFGREIPSMGSGGGVGGVGVGSIGGGVGIGIGGIPPPSSSSFIPFLSGNRGVGMEPPHVGPPHHQHEHEHERQHQHQQQQHAFRRGFDSPTGMRSRSAGSISRSRSGSRSPGRGRGGGVGEGGGDPDRFGPHYRRRGGERGPGPGGGDGRSPLRRRQGDRDRDRHGSGGANSRPDRDLRRGGGGQSRSRSPSPSTSRPDRDRDRDRVGPPLLRGGVGGILPPSSYGERLPPILPLASSRNRSRSPSAGGSAGPTFGIAADRSSRSRSPRGGGGGGNNNNSSSSRSASGLPHDNDRRSRSRGSDHRDRDRRRGHYHNHQYLPPPRDRRGSRSPEGRRDRHLARGIPMHDDDSDHRRHDEYHNHRHGRDRDRRDDRRGDRDRDRDRDAERGLGGGEKGGGGPGGGGSVGMVESVIVGVGGGAGPGGGGGAGADRHLLPPPPRRRRRRHPSERYADEPMLCEYLWKVDEKTARNGGGGDDDDDENAYASAPEADGQDKNDEAGSDGGGSDRLGANKNAKAKNDDSGKVDTGDEADAAGGGGAGVSGSESTGRSAPGNGDNDNDAGTKAGYDSYRSSYCLRYVRTFFNAHMDDPWFRARYSPLERKRAELKERSRAAREARTLREECEESLAEFRKRSLSRRGGVVAAMAAVPQVCSFVAEARLGDGIKPSGSPTSGNGGGGGGGGGGAGIGDRLAPGPSSSTTAVAAAAVGNAHMGPAGVGGGGGAAGGGTGGSPTPRKRKFSSEKYAPSYGATLSLSTTADVGGGPGAAGAGGASDDFQQLLDRDDGNSVPPSHLFASVRSNTIVRVMDVPPHVTDEQLSFALGEHCDDSVEGGVLEVFSGPPAALGGGSGGGIGGGAFGFGLGGMGGAGVMGGGAHVPTYDELLKGGSGSEFGGGSGEDALYRSAWAVFGSEAARDKMITNLTKANVAANRHRGDSRDSTPKVLELDVDCTDPYGRYEIDHDGKGSAPPAEDFSSDEEDDAGGQKKKEKAAKTAPRLPLRRSTVFVSTAPVASTQPVSVLSAAVSSSARFAKDRTAAVMIARNLDNYRHIPRGDRLDDVLEKLFFGGEEAEEDVLDVTVAYLRRVHLFSFYNGCTATNSLGATLSGFHPSGTIHLRLKGADEILKKAAEEQAVDDIYGDLPEPGDGGGDGDDDDEDNRNDDGAEKKEGDVDEEGEDEGDEKKSLIATDMLVMRLDRAIERALEESSSRLAESGDAVLDREMDKVASEIEFLESQSRKNWIDQHAIIDGDGRARCSFHFCRKLFKDKTFLQKHLNKKHPEFMKAEAAKCHDQYMMRSWDAEKNRPVPPILVDCGSKFGLVPSAVVGGEMPTAEDPEPDLWRKEQERLRQIEEEEALRRERRAAHEAARAAEERRREERESRAAAMGEEEGPRKRKVDSSFVDVDDMEDEKVELSFENVDVVAPPKKKKKKKKKLL